MYASMNSLFTVEKNTDKKRICQVSGKIYNISRIRNSASRGGLTACQYFSTVDNKVAIIAICVGFCSSGGHVKKESDKSCQISNGDGKYYNFCWFFDHWDTFPALISNNFWNSADFSSSLEFNLKTSLKLIWNKKWILF